jgi:hypothetical protein
MDNTYFYPFQGSSLAGATRKRSTEMVSVFIATVDKDGNLVTYQMDSQPEPILGIVLMVNPASISVNMSKIINRTPTMVGWLEEHWGEEMDTITFQGSTASFMVAPEGLATADSRRNSPSYIEMKRMISLMNANGAVFDPQGFVRDRVYIQVSYDYASYRGYFESFDVTEAAESPYRFTYTITFKSEKTVYSFTARNINYSFTAK